MNARLKPRRSRRPQWIAAGIVVGTLLVGGLWVKGRYDDVVDYPTTPLGTGEQVIALEIPNGAGLQQVIEQLESANILPAKTGSYFKLYVLHKGAANQIKAGDHEFRASMTPDELLEELLRRPAAPVFRATIPEGKHMLDVAGIIANAGGPDVEKMLAAMRDPKLLAELDIPRSSAEGYLFPDTYQFARKDSAASIVRKLVARHHQVYAELHREHIDEAHRLEREFGWKQPEIVTLASIVEKETGASSERPLIAGVFLNRLRFPNFTPKLLQTDPTIIYGCILGEPKSEACQQFEGRIRRIHLRDPDNIYNTYTHEGLPPGPISNPGRAALEAVFDPTRSRFLYFVSRNDGTHKFSATRAEHEAAVERHMRQGVVGDG